MIKNGKPPIKAVNIGPPIIAQNPTTKEYVDNIIPIVPVPPVYTATGTATRDIMVQGYIPTGVNTTFRLSVLGGLLYKQGILETNFQTHRLELLWIFVLSEFLCIVYLKMLQVYY